MSTPISMTVNGRTLEQLGFAPGPLTGWLAGPSYGYLTSDVVGRYGQVVTGVNVTAQPRDISFAGLVKATSLLDRRNKLDALARQLTGRLELATVDDPTKVCFGYLQKLEPRVVGPSFINGDPRCVANVTIRCYDPLWYLMSPLTMSTSVSGERLAFSTQGSAPMRRVQIKVHGVATSGTHTLTFKRGDGSTITQLRITGALTSSEYWQLELDPDIFTFQKWSAGAATDAWTTLNAADGFGACLINPLDAPTIEWSSTTSIAALEVTYYPAFWS